METSDSSDVFILEAFVVAGTSIGMEVETQDIFMKLQFPQDFC